MWSRPTSAPSSRNAATRQRLRFNVVVEVRPVTEPLEDDVDRILSYDRITEAIAAELAAERLNLLETLAERVAERILAEPQAMRVFIRIEKLDVGPYALGVEIVRSRAERRCRRRPRGRRRLHPLVVFLDNADDCRRRTLRPGWMRLQARGPAADPGRGPAGPAAPGDRPQARPSAGSTCWPSSRTPGPWPRAIARCVVVATRTEIDWAMKRGQTVVWAPSKLVLDAVDGPQGSEPVALALWLAETMAAERAGRSRRCCGSGRKPRAGRAGLSLPPCQAAALRPIRRP